MFLRDVVGVTISRGQLAKIIAKVSDALDGPYQELLPLLPDEAILNVDETGHKGNGEPWWTWCFRARPVHPVQDRPASLRRRADGRAGQGVRGRRWAAITSRPTAATCASVT